MRNTLVLAVSAAAMLTLLSACGDEAGEPSASAPAAVDVTAAVAADVAPPDATAPSDSSDSSGSPATVAEAEPSMSTATAAGASTGGEQPTLSWDAVDGAVLYSLVVHTADGQPFWGWLGDATSVTVGDGAPDPLVSDDMTWTVVALDADDTPIWESDPLPL